MWVSGIELRSTDLATSIFTHETIFLALFMIFTSIHITYLIIFRPCHPSYFSPPTSLTSLPFFQVCFKSHREKMGCFSLRNCLFSVWYLQVYRFSCTCHNFILPYERVNLHCVCTLHPLSSLVNWMVVCSTTTYGHVGCSTTYQWTCKLFHQLPVGV